jgi:FMN phosphatase YigB (HAD superfamily)
MAGTVLARLGLTAEVTAMVGDRLLTDMAMAAASGMVGIWVRNPATSATPTGVPVPTPAFVIEAMSQLVPAGGWPPLC